MTRTLKRASRVVPATDELIMHGHFEEALDKIRRCLGRARHGVLDRRTTVLLGGTGIGKSALLELLKREYEETYPDSQIPFVLVEAPAPVSTGGSFSIPDLIFETLSALHEPLIEHKTYDADEDEQADELGPELEFTVARFGKTTSARMRSLLRAIEFRGTKVLAIDEAQHLAQYTTSRQLHAALDVLKQLTKRSSARILLAGTAEAGAFVGMSPQLRRLIQEVHLEPYAADADGLDEFASVIAFLQERAGERDAWEGTLDLSTRVQELHHWSVGSVGHLVRLIRDAEERAQGAKKARLMTWEDIDHERWDDPTLAGFWHEADTTSRLLAQADRQELRIELGFLDRAGEPTSRRTNPSHQRKGRKIPRRAPKYRRVGGAFKPR